MAVIKKTISIGDVVEISESSYTAGENVNSITALENSLAILEKIEHRVIIWFNNFTQVNLRVVETYVHAKTCT